MYKQTNYSLHEYKIITYLLFYYYRYFPFIGRVLAIVCTYIMKSFIFLFRSSKISPIIFIFILTFIIILRNIFLFKMEKSLSNKVFHSLKLDLDIVPLQVICSLLLINKLLLFLHTNMDHFHQ